MASSDSELDSESEDAIPKGFSEGKVEKISKDDVGTLSLLLQETEQSLPFIPTLRCTVKADNTAERGINGIWDSGSTNSYISSRLIKILKPKRVGQSTMNRRTLDGVQRVTVDLFQLEIESETEKYGFSAIFMLTPSIVTLPSANWTPSGGLEKLKLAQFYPHGELVIDLLFGVDLLSKILEERVMKFDTYFAMKSHFGWTIAGYWQGSKNNRVFGLLAEAKSDVIVQSPPISNADLDRRLEAFWKVEEAGIHGEGSEEVLTVGEREAVMKLEQGRTFNNNQYSLPILWKTDSRPRNNFSMAVKRLESLERKLKKDPEVEQLYHEEFRKLEAKGLIERISFDRRQEAAFYLPNRPVVRRNPDGSINKVRPVFDAAARDSSGHKLNDFIWAGPARQTNLCGILLRFRLGLVAISWDVKSMFHCFLTNIEDQDYQRFIHRYEEGGEIIIYRAKMSTFGITDSPYKCCDTFFFHCFKYQISHPTTSATMIRNIFVDDEIAAMVSAAAALKFISEAKFILSEAGMSIHKISTNSEIVKRGLLAEEVSENEVGVELKESKDLEEMLNVEDRGALGMQWKPKADVFTFEGFGTLCDDVKITKRTISSKAGSVWDPIGMISPYLIRSKVILRQCWIEKLDWDSEVSPEIAAAWKTWLSELVDLETLRIPRCIVVDEEIVDMQVVGFGDASQKAYCAAIFLRVEYRSGLVDANLLTSKTRVAPSKVLSLPRLELMAMVINCRLAKFVIAELDHGELRTTFFSDSKTCLQWVRRCSSTWKCFVANKVAEIHGLSKIEDHFWCPGLENPSDRGTRGITVKQLEKETLWFKGPDWLILSRENWPKEDFPGGNDEALSEKRPVTLAALEIPDKTIFERLVARFSGVSNIINCVGYLNRMIKRAKEARERVQTGRMTQLDSPRLPPRSHLVLKKLVDVPKITGFEWNEALNTCFRAVQKLHFGPEWAALTSQPTEELPKESKLEKFLPYFDQDIQLIRIKGRLQESDLPESAKHQILLPSKCDFVRKFLLYFHRLRAHEPSLWFIAWLKQRVWILRARQEVNSARMKCLHCFKRTAKPAGQVMSSPPRSRVIISRPFSTVGLDQAGPVFVRMPDGSKEKRWICLYTCASTRAVILDVLDNMNTNTFILSFRRFIARRGLPLEVWSDNHASLKKGNKELVTLWRMLDKMKIEAEEQFKHVEWHWTTPKAPWTGGFFERLQAMMKECLYGALKGACLSDVELRTVILETEQILNDRPLSGTYSEATDSVQALTPNQLTFGHNLAPFPVISSRKVKSETCPIKIRWRHRQTVLNHFERMWSKLYLFELQKRTKWTRPERDIQVGEIVLLRDSDRVPRATWPLARVIETALGRDDRVRKVLLKVRGKELWRPIQAIFPTEIRDEEDLGTGTVELINLVDKLVIPDPVVGRDGGSDPSGGRTSPVREPNPYSRNN